MTARKSPIVFDSIRLLGIGRLTACTHSTIARPGILIGSRKGLFLLSKPDAPPQKIRRNPVGYLLSGELGAVCYEESGGRGQFAILDESLETVRVDTGLPRKINPVAYWNDGLVILHKAEFLHMEIETGARKHLADFVPTRSLSPLAKTAEGFDFIAVMRGPKWPTYLYRLVLPSPEKKAAIETLAEVDSPVVTRQFLRMANGDYLVVPQGKALFSVLRIYPEDREILRQRSVMPIAGEAHPVGMTAIGSMLYVAAADCLLKFNLSDELSGNPVS